jgi:hypothetical protein
MVQTVLTLLHIGMPLNVTTFTSRQLPSSRSHELALSILTNQALTDQECSNKLLEEVLGYEGVEKIPALIERRQELIQTELSQKKQVATDIPVFKVPLTTSSSTMNTNRNHMLPKAGSQRSAKDAKKQRQQDIQITKMLAEKDLDFEEMAKIRQASLEEAASRPLASSGNVSNSRATPVDRLSDISAGYFTRACVSTCICDKRRREHSVFPWQEIRSTCWNPQN